MSNIDEKRSKHLKITDPSPWVARWADLIKQDGTVLDLAAGGGRHARLFLNRGNRVTLVDKLTDALDDLKANPKANVVTADLEDGSPWPLKDQTFDAVIVVNYLYRPIWPQILDSLNPGGILIYETFAMGNETYSRPRNPDHLLKQSELLDISENRLQVLGFEQGLVTNADIPGVKQRLCAVNDLDQIYPMQK